ncbi:MAG: hypothetical protein I3270_02010 [Candidatus Moeniiplasma glomeromycotorum]|nr:hypothetical protein [Candidatus Moeniiplasma glomeromycotorum]MCE8162473.1 hypothetical protein [Candidatus Moeniiplasma glomeromycotorum]MCE8166400.1 hypothetical protein [Candidatus Moeniiplasma glomeromycotorum]MCE8166885.1 hypothetical protein [Candidatus Moeniiplasma glomeromycotorum]
MKEEKLVYWLTSDIEKKERYLHFWWSRHNLDENNKNIIKKKMELLSQEKLGIVSSCNLANV